MCSSVSPSSPVASDNSMDGMFSLFFHLFTCEYCLWCALNGELIGIVSNSSSPNYPSLPPHIRCDMYNSSIFLGIVAFLSFLAAFIWDIWGSFDHSDSKLFGNGPWIKPPPPGFDRKALAKQGARLAGWGGAQQAGQQGAVSPGAYPGQGGAPKKSKNSKALW